LTGIDGRLRSFSGLKRSPIYNLGMKSFRGVVITLGFLTVGVIALLLLWKSPGDRERFAPGTLSSPAPATGAPAAAKVENQKSPAESSPAGSPIADNLNVAEGTIRRDLEILNELFGAYHTNFPRIGNPVGENAEITAALLGDNPAGFVFIARSHRAINARGELCDRWGTPFRFHQLSGTQMEIRSAGPDRKFGTADDALFTP
jgi:hypothetical protein